MTVVTDAPEGDADDKDSAAALAYAHAPEAIAALARLMCDESIAPASRVAAANALLKWGAAKEAALRGKGAKVEQVVHLSWSAENPEDTAMAAKKA
jgi:hypothetical protein